MIDYLIKLNCAVSLVLGLLVLLVALPRIVTSDCCKKFLNDNDNKESSFAGLSHPLLFSPDVLSL